MLTAFASLRHRNFKLYLGGQLFSLIGTWMQSMAISWLVYRLTGSTFWLGVVTFCSQIPTFLFGLFAGVLVDRVNRHRLLILTQTLQALQAFALAFLTIYGKITLTEIIVLSTLLGIINSVDMPTRQAFVVQMIGNKKDLPNAIAMNSSVMHGTRLIGPAIAGVLIATLGEGPCFLINALSYISVLVALLMMKVEVPASVKSNQKILPSLKEGIRAAFGFRPIGSILILLSIMSLFGMPYMTLFPALAATTLKGDAHTLGLVSSAAALGGFGAAVFLASRKNVLKLGRLIGLSGLMMGLGMLALSQSYHLEVVLPVLFFTGLGMMLQMACGNTLIQTLVEDDKRGRVMSIFTFALMGVFPFGSLFIGALAEKIGIMHTLSFCGILCILSALWFLRRIGMLSSEVHPVYLKMGLLESTLTPEKFVF